MRALSKQTAVIGAVVAVAAAAGIYVAVSATGSSSPKLSVARVHAAAAKLGVHGAACPLRFDRAAAAHAAGADTAFAPVTDPENIAWGQVPEGSESDSPAVQYGMSTVGCGFTTTVHGARVELEIQVFAASKGSVLNAIAPLLQHDAELAHGTLVTFFSQKNPVPVGQVRLLQGDATAAVGRFDPDGSGDVVLEVSQVLSNDDKPAPVRYQALAEKLLGQIGL
jgi:hypothetical protein